MEFILNNWALIVAGAASVAVAIVAAYRFVGLPSEKQLDKVKEWLLWAVTEAEKELGGGTGQLKLRQVYDLFVTRFPSLVKVVPFTLFSDLVDEALEKMRTMLDENQAARAFVEGGADSDGAGVEE